MIDSMDSGRSSLSKQLCCEQEQIHKLIDDWRAWWNELREYGVPHFGEMGLKIKEIRNDLNQHFKHEEQASCFPRIAQVDEEKRATVERLLQQHIELIAELDVLSRLFQTSGNHDMTWGDAGKTFEKFLDRLERHEQNETQLISEASAILDHQH